MTSGEDAENHEVEEWFPRKIGGRGMMAEQLARKNFN